jgi:DnaJ-class molecular chaperone
MTHSKKPQPVGRCFRCGTPSLSSGQDCSAGLPGKPKSVCSGRVQSFPDTSNWQECTYCAATGDSMDKACPECKGWGWIFVAELMPK